MSKILVKFNRECFQIIKYLYNVGCYVLKEMRGINKERVLKFPLCEFICTSLIGINKYAINKH